MIENTDPSGESETLEDRLQWDGSAGTAADYIRALEADNARLRADAERLTAETECGACGGTPPVSGRPCVCGGSNRASKEAQGLREIAFDEMRRAEAAEARAARLEEALEKVETAAADAAFNAHQAADHPTAKMDDWIRARLRQGIAGNATLAASIARAALNPEGGEHADD
jgi:hypothetical protein